nr:MAG TPA: hypothetical protein [Caudoviricetes sp.]DAR39318.1 MAG TPA: hypothetical protein [Caudoviricetes sp.]DAY63416.1 MAG TPA: hypothetical protein [Caudoviricetes sp.]
MDARYIRHSSNNWAIFHTDYSLPIHPPVVTQVGKCVTAEIRVWK